MKAYDFLYGERTLSSFGCMICQFDGAKGLDVVSNGAEITFNSIPTLNGQKYELASTQYESCLEATIQICKCSCGSDIQEITPVEFRELTKWLNRRKFIKFKLLEESYIDLYYEISFNISRIEIDGRLYGLELQAMTNRPFALKEPKTIVINATSEYIWNKYALEKKYYTVETYLGHSRPSNMSSLTPRNGYGITKDGYFVLGNYISSSSDSPAYCYINGQTTNPKSIYKYIINYDSDLGQYTYSYYLLTLDFEYEKSELIEDVSARSMNIYPLDGMQNGYWYVYAGIKKAYNKNHSINDESYEEGYIYPYTEITITESGNLSIYNAMENRDTYIANCTAGEVITMDYPVIQSSISSHDIQNDFNWNFFRIANTYEESKNDLTISLPCIIKVKYSPIVKVGL